MKSETSVSLFFFQKYYTEHPKKNHAYNDTQSNKQKEDIIMSKHVSKIKQVELDQKAEEAVLEQKQEQQQQEAQPTMGFKPEGFLQKGTRILGTFLGRHKGKIAFTGGVVTGAVVTAAVVKNTNKKGDDHILIEQDKGTLMITDTTYTESESEGVEI